MNTADEKQLASIRAGIFVIVEGFLSVFCSTQIPHTKPTFHPAATAALKISPQHFMPIISCAWCTRHRGALHKPIIHSLN